MLLDDIGDLLSSGGTTADGTEVRLGIMPDKPDTVATVYETPGMAPIRAMRSATGQPVAERPRIQVVVRGAAYDYVTPRLKANDIYRLLENYAGTINGVRYLWIAAVNSPAPMMTDAAGRMKMVVNFDVTKELSTA